MVPDEPEESRNLGRAYVEFCQVLQQRFNYLTDLRTMTAHRHITLIGVVGAFMAGVFQFGGQDGQTLIARLLPPASIILLVLGVCVTVYDAMIRRRAWAVTLEMSRIVTASGMPVYEDKKQGFPARFFRVFDEDFFFFSQILIVNALTALPLVMTASNTRGPKIQFGIEAYWVYLGAVVFLGVCGSLHIELTAAGGPPIIGSHEHSDRSARPSE